MFRASWVSIIKLFHFHNHTGTNKLHRLFWILIVSLGPVKRPMFLVCYCQLRHTPNFNENIIFIVLSKPTVGVYLSVLLHLRTLVD